MGCGEGSLPSGVLRLEEGRGKVFVGNRRQIGAFFFKRSCGKLVFRVRMRTWCSRGVLPESLCGLLQAVPKSGLFRAVGCFRHLPDHASSPADENCTAPSKHGDFRRRAEFVWDCFGCGKNPAVRLFSEAYS